MKINRNQQYEQTTHDQEYPAPQQIHVTSGGGAIVVIVSFLFSITILYATSQNGQAATPGMWGSVLFFGFFTPIGLMAANGSLAQIFRYWQEQRTVRELNRQATQRVALLDPMQLPYSDPTQPLALPHASTYVPAQAEPDNSAKREAAAWLLQLYGQDGQPDPKKVLMKSEKERPGRVRIAAPSRPAKQWLMEHGILLDLGGTGFRLNLVRCPTITAAQTHLNLANGVARIPTHHPHGTATLHERGVPNE